LTQLTKKLHTIAGDLSLSSHSYNYSLNKYNQDWQRWINQGWVTEYILQNYVENKFEQELIQFIDDTKSLKANFSIGIYAGVFFNKKDTTKLEKLVKAYGFSYTLFSWQSRFS
jgi:uncharacterized lipoprotein YddW (UPF0748 family)